jgi:hypothetical protein
MLNSEAIDPEAVILDVWDLVVEKVVLGVNLDGKPEAKYDEVMSGGFQDVAKFLADAYRKHKVIQKRVITCGKSLVEAVLCPTCSALVTAASVVDERCPHCLFVDVGFSEAL